MNSLAMPPAFSVPLPAGPGCASGHGPAQIGEAVGDGDDGLAKIGIFHAGGAPRGRRRHIAAVGGGAGTVCGHSGNPVADAAKGILCGGLADRARAAAVGWTSAQRVPCPGLLLAYALFRIATTLTFLLRTRPAHANCVIKLFFSALFWGASAIAGKWLFAVLRPAQVTFLRFALAALALGAVVTLAAAAGRLRWAGVAAGGAGCGGGVAVLLLFEGLQYSSAFNAGLIEATIPLVTLALSVLLKKSIWIARRPPVLPWPMWGAGDCPGWIGR
ncbi:MAG: DMT family transporter [Rivihabitans pingtungensis]